MNNYKNLPVFDSDLKPYEPYIEELKTWCLVTDLPKQKQGVAKVLSLPESDASGIWDKVFNEITLTNEVLKMALINYLMSFQKYMNASFNLNVIKKPNM